MRPFSLCFATCLLSGSVLSSQTLPWIDISGTWKLQERDDAGFTRPDLDDTSWPQVTLPKEFEFRGRNTNRYFWLRRTVELPEAVDRSKLALTLGKLTENYEVYVNGQDISHVGKYNRAESRIARPRTFDLPPIASGRLVIAIRLWLHRFSGSDIWRRGLDPGPYLITAQSNAPRAAGTNFLQDLRLKRTPDLVTGVALMTLALILLLIYLSQRTRSELMWLSLLCAVVAVRRLNTVLAISLDSTPWEAVWFDSYAPLSNAALLEFLAATLHVRVILVRSASWILVAVSVVTGSISAERFSAASVSYVVVAIGLVWVLARCRDREYGHYVIAAAAGAVILFSARGDTGLSYYVGVLPRNVWTFGPYEVNSYSAITAAFALVMVLVLTRRLLADQAEKQRLSSELEAAKTVQSLLLARAQTVSGAYIIDAAYEPAQEVGGDFYQVLPVADGGVLVVVGDVSGKGLRAAMLVAMAAGILRSRSQLSPAALLTELNRSMGDSLAGGFVTCLIALLSPDGKITAANAGHLPPYIAGNEWPLDNSLPLGVVPDAVYSETTSELLRGAVLTLISDGVVEAANSHGELFGFDRTQQITGQAASAIAEAAKAWGQNDDITVVTVRRAS